jgi:hypothetical protein
MNKTLDHKVPDTAAESTVPATPTITQPCPPWCTYEHGGIGDDLHMSDAHTVPCFVTAREDGHLCGYTTPSDPRWAQESCDVQNFAQICGWDRHGQPWVEVGHGDDLLPAMTIDAAGQLAACLTALVAEARKAMQA